VLANPQVVLQDSWATVRQYALGGWHTLVLLEDGQLVAFGSNDVGQLGIRTAESTVAVPRPVALPTGVRIAHIACGSRHSAAVSIDGRVYVWGGGVEDVLGFPHLSASVAIPTLVAALSAVVIVTVACGGAHTLFVSATGAVFAAGSNAFAQCGVDECASTAIVRLPRALFDGEAVHHVAAGVQHSAALTVAGSVYCWGDDSERQCAGALTRLCRRRAPSSFPTPARRWSRWRAAAATRRRSTRTAASGRGATTGCASSAASTRTTSIRLSASPPAATSACRTRRCARR
jgi:alpha-tubulin suppressor-like RCC1 family protein